MTVISHSTARLVGECRKARQLYFSRRRDDPASVVLYLFRVAFWGRREGGEAGVGIVGGTAECLASIDYIVLGLGFGLGGLKPKGREMVKKGWSCEGEVGGAKNRLGLLREC